MTQSWVYYWDSPVYMWVAHQIVLPHQHFVFWDTSNLGNWPWPTRALSAYLITACEKNKQTNKQTNKKQKQTPKQKQNKKRLPHKKQQKTKKQQQINKKTKQKQNSTDIIIQECKCERDSLTSVELGSPVGDDKKITCYMQHKQQA